MGASATATLVVMALSWIIIVVAAVGVAAAAARAIAMQSKEHRLSVLRQRSAVASLHLGQKGQDNDDIDHSICKSPFSSCDKVQQVDVQSRLA